MNEIKRFNGKGGMYEYGLVDYVLYQEHYIEANRLNAEVARLRAELQNAAKAALDAVALSCDKEREADALRAEVEWLRVELAETNDRFEKYRHSASKDYAALFARKDACANDVAIYKDAQRYRWLRAGSGTTWDQPWVAVGHCDIEWVNQPNEIEGKQLDDAIDAAMGASA